MSRYEDILHLPHPEPERRVRMPLADRAAQFAPFAALTGLEGTLAEAGRLTDSRPILTESALEELDRCQRELARRLGEGPWVTVTWFRPDSRKPGGALLTFRGQLQAIDGEKRCLRFADGTAIAMECILALEEHA